MQRCRCERHCWVQPPYSPHALESDRVQRGWNPKEAECPGRPGPSDFSDRGTHAWALHTPGPSRRLAPAHPASSACTSLSAPLPSPGKSRLSLTVWSLLVISGTWKALAQCVNCVFYFLDPGAVASGPCRPWRRRRSQWQPNLTGGKHQCAPFMCKPTYPEPTHPRCLLCGLSHSGPLSPCPPSPRPGVRQTARTDPVPRSPLKLPKPASPKSPSPASPTPSRKPKHRLPPPSAT